MNSIITGPASAAAYAQHSANLKRKGPEGYSKGFDGSRAPRLPQINSDLILQVFTHVSLRRDNVKPEQYDDNERLAVLGRVVLDAAITQALFRRRPFLTATEIKKQREQLFSRNVFEDWVTHYNLRNKLRCRPDVRQKLRLRQETETIFNAYVGGVFMTSGPEAVNDWIQGLLLQEELEPEDGSDVDSVQTVRIPPLKRPKSETLSPMIQPTIFFASQPPPSPPPRKDPPPHFYQVAQPAPNMPNPLAPAQPGLPFLPLFNQAAMQRRVMVEYPAEFSGPPHAGRWTVRCVVNGICKGSGSGSSKQLAKEEAARQAYYSMGWT